jgi:hypothetical protein
VKRRIFNILSALSLLLLVAMVVLWSSRYWWKMALTRYGIGDGSGLSWFDGVSARGRCSGSTDDRKMGPLR